MALKKKLFFKFSVMILFIMIMNFCQNCNGLPARKEFMPWYPQIPITTCLAGREVDSCYMGNYHDTKCVFGFCFIKPYKKY